MNTQHAMIEAHVSLVQQEIRQMAQLHRDGIHVRVGWMIRSNGQRRRWENAKKEVAQNEK